MRHLNERCVPVILNSFYGGNSQWFKRDDFMGGMWKDVRGGNGAWTVLMPDGRYLDEEIGKGWAKWLRLPESARRPGAFPVAPPAGRPRGAPPSGPPPGTLVVRVRQRNLERTAGGGLARLTEASARVRWDPKYNGSFADVMWLSEAEWKSLVPPSPRKGDRFPLPEAVKRRLLLWHLTNRTFCVGEPWYGGDVRSEDLTLRVEEVSPVIRLRLQGSVLLEMAGTPEEVAKDWQRTRHGYDARVLGFLDYDPSKGAFTLFDLVAIGDYWGGDCEGGRHGEVGRLPLGIAFELADGDSVRDRILPCGGVHFDRYLGLK